MLYNDVCPKSNQLSIQCADLGFAEDKPCRFPAIDPVHELEISWGPSHISGSVQCVSPMKVESLDREAHWHFQSFDHNEKNRWLNV